MSSMGMIPKSCLCLHVKITADFTSPSTQVPMSPTGNSQFKFVSLLSGRLVKGICLAVVLVLTATLLYAEDQDRITSLSSSVSALHSARQTALDELESLSLSAKEATDYRDFIVYLNTRISNYCRELAEQGGASALKGLTCPAESMVTGASATQMPTTENIFYTTGPGTAETQAEKTAEIEGAFLTTLGEFDEMLLREDDKIATRVPSQRESSSQSGMTGSDGTSGDTGETGSGENGETGEQGEGAEGDATADGQEGQSEAASGTQSQVGGGNADVDHSAYGAPGGKLPPPEDDDIVARQLREAAEKEPDLELKNKLWEEYWKYKGVKK